MKGGGRRHIPVTLGNSCPWECHDPSPRANRIVRLLGGGKCTTERALQTWFGGLRKWDWSGLCPFPLRRTMTGREKGRGNRIIGGGVQNRFWGGVLWYVFPSPEFSTPFCFSLTNGTRPRSGCVTYEGDSSSEGKLKYPPFWGSPPFLYKAPPRQFQPPKWKIDTLQNINGGGEISV